MEIKNHLFESYPHNKRAPMKFKEFRKYISKIDRVSICNNDTLAYRNYQFIEDVPDDYDEMYFYGVGIIKSEFP